MTTTTPATLAHAEEAAARMSPADAAEVSLAAGGVAVAAALRHVLEHSAEAWAVHIGGELAALWGVVAAGGGLLSGRVGVLWVVATDVARRRPKAFVRACKAALASMRQRWDELHNLVTETHRRGLRWAENLGVEFGEPTPGPGGVMVCRTLVRRGA